MSFTSRPGHVASGQTMAYAWPQTTGSQMPPSKSTDHSTSLHCRPEHLPLLLHPVTLPACLQDGTLSMDELCLLVERMIKEQERAMWVGRERKCALIPARCCRPVVGCISLDPTSVILARCSCHALTHF
jgi:hypothetical protein